MLDGAAGRIVYFAFRETSGTAKAVIRLWDGSGAKGKLLLPLALAEGTSTASFPGFHSLPYTIGLYLQVVTGTVEGSVSIIPEVEWPGEGIPVVVTGGITVTVQVPTTG